MLRKQPKEIADSRLREVLNTASSLAERGYLRCVGSWPDGTPKYELTNLGRAELDNKERR